MNKYKRVDNLSWRRVEDEVLIIDSRINQEVHRLNGVASLIWEKCDGLSEIELLDEVISHYEVTKEEAKDDLKQFLEELKNKKIIETY